MKSYKDVVGMAKRAAGPVGAVHPKTESDRQYYRDMANSPFDWAGAPATGTDAAMRRQDASYDSRNPVHAYGLTTAREWADSSRRLYNKALLDKALNPAGVELASGAPKLKTDGTWVIPGAVRTWDPLRDVIKWKAALGSDTAKYNMMRQLARP